MIQIAVILAVCITSAFSACDFPERMRATWWQNLNAANTVILQDIDADRWEIHPEGGAVTDSYTCDTLESVQFVDRIFRLNSDPAVLGDCVVNTIDQDEKMMLQKVHPVEGVTVHAGECDTTIPTDSPARVLPKYPFDTTELCPLTFYPGSYQVTYDVAADGDDNCLDNQSSYVDISERHLDMHTCYGETVNYDSPFRLEFECAGNFQANSVSVTDITGGDILILKAQISGVDVFFCARYNIDHGNEEIVISLGVQDDKNVHCYTEHRYDTVSDAGGQDKYRKFTLTPNECLRDTPCQNGGTCTQFMVPEDGKRYNCSCPTGFDGEHCENNIDECESSPCQNNGTCHRDNPEPGSYRCECVGEFYGTHCEHENCDLPENLRHDEWLVDWDGDISSPVTMEITKTHVTRSDESEELCKQDDIANEFTVLWTEITALTSNNRMCLTANAFDNVMLYKRAGPYSDAEVLTVQSCMNGKFTGDYILGYKSPVTFNTCPFTATTYTVTYQSDGSDQQCVDDEESDGEVDDLTVNLNSCGTTNTYEEPVKGTLKCVNNFEFEDNNYVVLASEDLTFFYCARYEEVDRYVHLSLNIEGGQLTQYCDTTSNAQTVDAEHVYIQLESNKCDSNPCQHGGTCEDGMAVYTCSCVDGYTGDHCETDIDDCEIDPCLNGGTCHDEVDGNRCECPDTHRGDVCEDLKDCDPDPCVHGECIEQAINQGYECNCDPGWTGTNCETGIDECESNPCLNNGECVDLLNAYRCDCPDGVTGDHCEDEVNECLSQPCINGGTCYDRRNAYHCECPREWRSVNCELENNCHNEPCLNGGTCRDDYEYFECTCPYGFHGEVCQNKGFTGDSCTPNPCENEGVCNITAYGARCYCKDGYSGDRCDDEGIDWLTVFLITLLCVLVVAAVITAAIFYYRRKQAQAAKDQEKGEAMSRGSTKRSSLSWYPEYKAKGAVNGVQG